VQQVALGDGPQRKGLGTAKLCHKPGGVEAQGDIHDPPCADLPLRRLKAVRHCATQLWQRQGEIGQGVVAALEQISLLQTRLPLEAGQPGGTQVTRRGVQNHRAPFPIGGRGLNGLLGGIGGFPGATIPAEFQLGMRGEISLQLVVGGVVRGKTGAAIDRRTIQFLVEVTTLQSFASIHVRPVILPRHLTPNACSLPPRSSDDLPRRTEQLGGHVAGPCFGVGELACSERPTRPPVRFLVKCQ